MKWEAHRSGVYEAVSGGRCVTMRHPEAGDEWIANRHLIAAAPDMLAVCQAVTESSIAPDCHLMDIARAAIAKANGESL